MKLPKNGRLLETLLSEHGFVKGPRYARIRFYYRRANGLETEYSLDMLYKNMIRFHIETKHSFGQAMPGVPELMKLTPPANGLGAWEFNTKEELDEILALFCDLLDLQIIPRLKTIENASYVRIPGAQENRYLYDNRLSLSRSFCDMEPGFENCSREEGVEILVNHLVSYCEKGKDADPDCLFRISAAYMSLLERFYDVTVEWSEQFGSCTCTYSKDGNHRQQLPANVGPYMWYLLNDRQSLQEAKEWMRAALSADIV